MESGTMMDFVDSWKSTKEICSLCLVVVAGDRLKLPEEGHSDTA